MDEKMLASIEARNMLGASMTVLESDSEQCSYIPLVNLRSEEESECKNLLRQLCASLNNLKWSVDFNKHIESDTYSNSQNISVNSSQKIKAHGDSQKNESPTILQGINSYLTPFQNPDRQNGIGKESTADDYTRIEREIYSSIKYSYMKALIAWCPTFDVESGLIHAWFKKSAAYMYDRWIRKDMPNATDAWGGVVAVYPDRITAKNAEVEIRELHESLTTIRLSTIIQCFVKSELKYFSEEKTEVLVHAKVSGIENIQKIQPMLHKFGNVEFCGYDYVIRNAAVDFRVTYTFATHALLTKTVLDNLPFDSGLLNVDVKMTPKTKAILDDFHCRLKKFIGNARFPF